MAAKLAMFRAGGGGERRLPVLEGLGRAAAEPHGSEAGMELGAQGSLLLMGGTVEVPHGSTEVAGLGADPGGKGRHSMFCGWGIKGIYR